MTNERTPIRAAEIRKGDLVLEVDRRNPDDQRQYRALADEDWRWGSHSRFYLLERPTPTTTAVPTDALDELRKRVDEARDIVDPYRLAAHHGVAIQWFLDAVDKANKDRA